MPTIHILYEGLELEKEVSREDWAEIYKILTRDISLILKIVSPNESWLKR